MAFGFGYEKTLKDLVTVAEGMNNRLIEIEERVGKNSTAIEEFGDKTSLLIKESEERAKLATIETNKAISNKMIVFKEEIEGLKERTEKLEYNVEVTDKEAEQLRDNAQRRVSEILGHNKLDHKKYFRPFIMKLYSDARHFSGMGRKIATTKNSEFQRTMDYIDEWSPRCGVANLKKSVDENAELNLRVKAMGYC